MRINVHYNQRTWVEVVDGGGGDDPRTNHRYSFFIYSLHGQPLLEQDQRNERKHGSQVLHNEKREERYGYSKAME